MSNNETKNRQIWARQPLPSQTIQFNTNPTETTLDVVSRSSSVTSDDVLDGTGEQVAIVRQTGRKRRAIVESVARQILGQLELAVECIERLPKLEDFELFLVKVDRRRDDSWFGGEVQGPNCQVLSL